MSKNNENKLVPRLRFPEFLKEGNWEDKILKQVSDVTSGQSPSGISYNEEGIGTPFYQGKTDFGDIFLKEPTKWTTEPTKFANADEILMSVRAPVGALNISTQKICIGRGLAAIQPKVNKWFLYYFLSRIKDRIIGNGGSVFDSINKEQIEKISVLIPQEQKEQQKIAACLSSLDDVITAESKKLEVLKEHKKGLLQNLFPQQGETVPKLRFKEFEDSGEWKEKYLNEISPAIFDGTHQTPSYTEKGVPFYSVENIKSGIKNKFISREDYLLSISKNKPEKGDIIITRIGDIGTSKVIDWNYEFSIYVTLAIVKKSTIFNSYYLHSFFQSSRYQKEILSKSLLNAVPCKINMDELRRTKILIPPDKGKKEQLKISEIFSSVDDLINSQSQKIETLKLHKKGLLQGLFPDVNEHNG